MKICVYAAAAGEDRIAYRARLKNDILPKLLDSHSDIVHCTLNLVDDELTGGLPGAKMGAEDADAGANYEAVIEYWIDAAASETDTLIKALLDLPGKLDAYWTEVFVAKDTDVAAERPSFLRLISPCFPKKGMSLPRIRKHWREHVERANRIHVGMSRYIQNWNMATLTPGSPAYFGTPMLSFQSMSDFTDRFYCDEAGAKEIAADVGSFVDSFAPLLTREHRLK